MSDGAGESDHGTEAHVPSGDDAVCFTAGVKGAPFSAGTIHAYLAAARKPPAVVAGVSIGALSAAAMQRSFKEIATTSGEFARWAWFRNYLNALCEDPLATIWDGLPDQADFFADMPPVRDPATPEHLAACETAALRQRHLLEAAGRWLADLRVPVSLAANTLVAWVRRTEGYGSWWQRNKFFWYFTWILLKVTRHLYRSPRVPREGIDGARRPLFKEARRVVRRVTCQAGLVLLLLPTCLVLGVLWFSGAVPSLPARVALLVIGLAPVLLAGALWPACTVTRRGIVKPARVRRARSACGLRRAFLRSLLSSVANDLELRQNLVHRFHLRIRLTRLFEPEALAGQAAAGDRKGLLDEHPMPLVMVVAPLQHVARPSAGDREPVGGSDHLWFTTEVPLITALEGALAVPGLLPPWRSTNPADELAPLPAGRGRAPLDLVDGAAVSQSPLPALLSFLRRPERAGLARILEDRSETGAAAIHVVYSVPIERHPDRPSGVESGDRLPDAQANIVDVGLASRRLAQRRDTELEVRQTNFITALENRVRRAAGPETGDDRTLAVLVDEIAPEEDLVFGNPLAPTAAEIRKGAAAGCRLTLERLYHADLSDIRRSPVYLDRLARLGGRDDDGGLDCAAFISTIAPGRAPAVERDRAPGLPEVCAECTHRLRAPAVAPGGAGPLELSSPTFRAAAPAPERGVDRGRRANYSALFPHLRGDRPRVIFVASGGVFRGAFHIGMIAALVRFDIKPDLIVGASVGTLMGAALAAILRAQREARRPGGPPADQAFALLGRLVEMFVRADENVALTRTLKTATRQVGVRCRQIDLSPRSVRRALARGFRSDPGYAAVGVPPELVDAVSDVFMIPRAVTATIVGKFVAGRVTEATYAFLKAVKEESLGRLDIRDAIMGASLLEPKARQVLVDLDPKTRQPFLSSDPRDSIAFFGTTTNLGSRSAFLLPTGVDSVDERYDFVQAALASSAFPVVFAPRRESEVFPGSGHVDVRLADGGMFDNLPFIPAVEILARVQSDHRRENGPAPRKDSLARRHREPDLFIAGSLEPDPDGAPDRDGSFENMFAIFRRSGALKANAKIRSFQRAAERVHRQIGRLLGSEQWQPAGILDQAVDAAVLSVVPEDSEHLNGTYHFCRSLGLDTERVQRSIAHGCFQTLRALVDARTASGLTRASIAGLGSRIPHVEWRGDAAAPGACPYFARRDDADGRQPFECPFAQAWRHRGTDATTSEAKKDRRAATEAVYNVCREDPRHQDRVKAAPGRAAPGAARPGGAVGEQREAA